MNELEINKTYSYIKLIRKDELIQLDLFMMFYSVAPYSMVPRYVDYRWGSDTFDETCQMYWYEPVDASFYTKVQ